MDEEASSVLRSLEYYRSSVDAARHSLAEGVVSAAYNSTLRALMNLLNFADIWYSAQSPAAAGDTRNFNLKVADDDTSLLIHLLLSRRICDLTGKLVAFSVQNRLLTRDTILTKVLTERKISDTSSALLFRLENVTSAFSHDEKDAASPRPKGFHEGLPDSLAFIETAKNGGYKELVGVDREVRELHKQIDAARTAKTSTMVLLHGPPGTGKTSLVSAAARENGLPVATVTTSNLGGEFIGEREQNITDLFDYLENVKTDYILFVDEADSFLPEAYENNTQARLIRVLTINRTLRLVGRDDGVTRIVVLATNYEERIARDVAESCFKIFLAAPSTEDQMSQLISFYRKRTCMNMTRQQSDYLTKIALTLGYAPAHVSLLMQRLLTNSIIKLLNNRVRLGDVSTGLLEHPVYMIEQNKSLENVNSATVRIAVVTDVPRSERDNAAAPGWESGESVCFPVPDLNVNYGSVLGDDTRTTADLPPPPPAIAVLDFDGVRTTEGSEPNCADSGVCVDDTAGDAHTSHPDYDFNNFDYNDLHEFIESEFGYIADGVSDQNVADDADDQESLVQVAESYAESTDARTDFAEPSQSASSFVSNDDIGEIDPFAVFDLDDLKF